VGKLGLRLGVGRKLQVKVGERVEVRVGVRAEVRVEELFFSLRETDEGPRMSKPMWFVVC